MLTKYHTCCYCGMPASEFDHVVPFSYNRTSKRKTKARNMKECVGSCEECNRMLTSFAFHTIPERAEYLARAIRKRYAKELKLPLWTDEELEDMGTSQARYIRDKQREKEEVLERISHCEMIALTEMTIEDYWERFPKLADLADNGLIYGVLPMLPVE